LNPNFIALGRILELLPYSKEELVKVGASSNIS